MFERILRKVASEVELLVVVAIMSLVVSSFLIVDATGALMGKQFSLALTAVRFCELSVAITWLLLSVKITIEISRLRRKHYRIFFLRKLKRLEGKEQKNKTMELVRDLVAFYRGYYLKTMVVLGLAIAISVLIVVLVAYLLHYGYMSFWEAVFRWGVNSLMLLFASALYVHVHRSWGRKLLKVKDGEKKLSEMLGGLIEA